MVEIILDTLCWQRLHNTYVRTIAHFPIRTYAQALVRTHPQFTPLCWECPHSWCIRITLLSASVVFSSSLSHPTAISFSVSTSIFFTIIIHPFSASSHRASIFSSSSFPCPTLLSPRRRTLTSATTTVSPRATAPRSATSELAVAGNLTSSLPLPCFSFTLFSSLHLTRETTEP
ncbi:hypothetical protein HN51_040412 [Arachis hypogaea]